MTLPIEKDDLVANRSRRSQAIVSRVDRSLSFHEESVTFEMVFVLDERVLLLLGYEEHDQLLTCGRNNAPADSVPVCVPPMLREIWPIVGLTGHEKIERHHGMGSEPTARSNRFIGIA